MSEQKAGRMHSWLVRMAETRRAVGQMVQLAWQAYPSGCVLLLIVELLHGLTPPALAWLTKHVFDLLSRSLQGTTPVSATTLAQPLLIFVIVGLLAQLCSPASRYLNSELGRALTRITQTRVYTKLAHINGLAPFEEPRVYDTTRLAVDGGHHGPSYAILLLSTTLRSAVTLLTMLGALLMFSPSLAILVTFVALPQLFVQLRLSQHRVQLAAENTPHQRRAAFYEGVLSNLEYAKELRLFGLGDYFLGRWSGTIRAVHTAERAQQARELRWQGGLTLLSSLINGVATVLVLLQAFNGRLSIGDVALYLGAVASVQVGLTDLTAVLANTHESVLFFRHYQTLLALPQPLPVAHLPTPVPPLQRGIELCNVSFRYTKEHPWVLRDVNLVIPAGQSVALVGLNGAGKTTLVKLLARLYDPTEGHVLWDGIDIRQFDPDAYRQHLGAILQDFVRYDMTAYENVALGNVACVSDPEQIYAAAQRADVHKTIERLPHAYETLLSRWLTDEQQTTGAELSGGQWQKIALARMFMRQADMLILDEPTAALDAQAEYDLFQHFTSLIDGRTALLISHRFSTVRMAHVIAVLEDGRINEYGSHDKLLRYGGVYAQLYTLQVRQYQEAERT